MYRISATRSSAIIPLFQQTKRHFNLNTVIRNEEEDEERMIGFPLEKKVKIINPRIPNQTKNIEHFPPSLQKLDKAINKAKERMRREEEEERREREKVTEPIVGGIPRGRLLFVTLVKSYHHEPRRIRHIIRQMGLKTRNQLQVLQDDPYNRGLVYMTRHLLRLQSISTAELFPQGTAHLQLERLNRKQKDKLFFKRKDRQFVQERMEEGTKYLEEKYGHFRLNQQ
ncbi:hypothetical protein AKO1_006728 [Acrasis kona]|uniref:Ribosomal protein L30 n=1 Tax=Acrasis kona TaxID=1008807 RepID=A0AAW2ZKU2_9EUKA